MYAPTNVEQAILNMNSPQPDISALNFINNWTQQPESIFTSLELILTSNYENVKVACCTYLSHSIINFWNQADSGQKINFRSNIIKFALDYDKKDQIFKFISIIIAHIAVFDYPEEWPEFSLIIFPHENLTDQYYFNSIKIFHKFAKDIQNSTNITEHRRNVLKSLILENITTIMNFLNKYIENPLFVKDSLGIYSYIILWIPNEEAVLPLILDKLIFQFLPNEELTKVSLKCLTSIFISRSDSALSFRKYSPYLISTLSKSTFSNQKPITTNVSVIEFIIRFLNMYILIFEIVFVFDRAQKETRFANLIDKSVNELVQTIVDKQISVDDLKNDVIHLLQVVLSIQPEDVKDSFWMLWSNILRRYKFETLCNFSVNPVCEFYQPFYPLILQCLYNFLPSAVNEGGTYIFQARGCFNSLFFINQEVFVQFLHAQQPSENLCYAVGILEFVLDSNNTIQSLSQIVIELLDTLNSSSMSQQYVKALLFCLPHSSCFFHDNNELFSRFIEFIINCINDDDQSISEAACKSLNYIVTNRVGLFRGDSRQFTENIIELTERFFYHLDQESSIKMYKICTILICHNTQIENPKELFHKLLQPVMVFMMSYLNQAKQIIQENGDLSQFAMNENIERAVLIICECTNAYYPSPIEIFNLVWQTLFELTIFVVSNDSFPNEIVSACLKTVAWVQSNRSQGEIDKENLIQQIFQAMIKRGSIDESIFTYVTIVRESDEGEGNLIDKFYPFIFQNFIVPLMKSEDDFPFIPLFMMFNSFNLKNIDIQSIIQFILKGIQDYRKDVNYSAVNCLKNILSDSSEEQLAFVIENFEISIVSTLIESITDEIHKEMIVENINFLRTLIRINSVEQLNRIVKNALIGALNKCAKEPSEGFYENFVNYIFSICNFCTPFREAFMNLLIVLRKASPGDCDLFEVQPVHQNIIYDEMIKLTQDEIKKQQ